MKKISILHYIALFLCFRIVAYGGSNPTLKTQYNCPGITWESDAIPLGNGQIGAMLFGDVSTDSILINEHTLWSGGPGKNPAYNGGHLLTPTETHQNLQSLRRALQDKMRAFSTKYAAHTGVDGNIISSNYIAEDSTLQQHIRALMGTKADFGSYQSLCTLHIDSDNKKTCTHYSRELNIDSALAQVSYTQNNMRYKREYFISHPHNTLIIRYTSSLPRTISRTIWLSTRQIHSTIQASADGSITFTGQPADQHAEGLKFAQYLKLKAPGGTISVSGQKLIVRGANELVIVLSAATNYLQCMDNTFNYFSTTNPLTLAEATVNKAYRQTYNACRSGHIADYRHLYHRVSFELNTAANVNNKTTPELLSGYKTNHNTTAENLYLEQLYYQYGRYLLIASSRAGGLPANLQGIWADGLRPPWDADYHTNINLQMNYWLAEPTNLSECHLPVIQYINSLVPRGRISANHYYCKPDGSPVRGWVIHHENNIWGNTGPGNWYEGFYFPAAAAWMCQDIWEYYQFTQDRDMLAHNFEILQDVALFWVDNLWRDDRDGTLVANPSYSPEHGPYTMGASCDQAIITELFDFTIKAYQELHPHQPLTPRITEIVKAKQQLAGPQIGLNGQFMEWKDETSMDITGDNHHRHVNQLFWLHPGSQIIPGRSTQDDRYAEAMKKTLNTRGDGGTGWSKAWKINFWARLRDGNHAHKLLEELLRESTLNNLFDTHPPFQIDGNFGATAGMTEMLIQSQGEYIELFPALPSQWPAGNFRGLRTRGNFELSATWHDQRLTRLEILSRSGNTCKLKMPDLYGYLLREKNGKAVKIAASTKDCISFPTEKGKVYVLNKVR